MKVLKVSRNGIELAKMPVDQPVATVGRSPTCNVVVRARGVRPVHYVLEWFGENPVGGDKGKWTIIDLSQPSAGSDSDGNDFGFGKILGPRPVKIGELEFTWVEDRLESKNIVGALTESLDQHSETLGYSDLLEVIEVDTYRDSVCKIKHISTFTGRRGYLLRPDGPTFQFGWENNLPDVRGRLLIKVSGDHQVSKVGGALKRMGAGEIHMSANDVIYLEWKHFQYYFRFVAALELPQMKHNPFDEPMLRNGIVVYFMVIVALLFVRGTYKYVPPVPDAVHSRVAKIEMEKEVESVEVKKKEVIVLPEEEDTPSPVGDKQGDANAKTADTPPPESVVPVKPSENAPPVPVAADAPPTPAAPAPVVASAPPKAVETSSLGLLSALQSTAPTQKVDLNADTVLAEPDMEIVGAFNNDEPGAIAVTEVAGVRSLDPTKKLKHTDLSKASSKLNANIDMSAINSGSVGKRSSLVQGASTTFGKSQLSLPKGDRIVDVSGGLTKSQVQKIVNSAQVSLKKCFESALIVQPALKGRLVFRWVVSTAGSVEAVQLVESEAKFDQFENCTLKVIEKLKFDAAPKPTEVVYPFVFK